MTVFDDEYPAVANLDPALLDALRRAATDAGADGVEFHVNSGWRSPAYQEQLLEEAVSKYGSRAEAARWVATPATSPHVSGDAVDIGRVRCHGVAVRARRRVRAVPDLRQRTLALRAASRSRRIRGALRCTPTPRRIQGCSSDASGVPRACLMDRLLGCASPVGASAASSSVDAPIGCASLLLLAPTSHGNRSLPADPSDRPYSLAAAGCRATFVQPDSRWSNVVYASRAEVSGASWVRTVAGSIAPVRTRSNSRGM